uniref:DUF3263 domain-containing protein n=1 Tax=Saccharopolyspora galaxeae TaxID=2781241 RepID=UPI0035B14118
MDAAQMLTAQEIARQCEELARVVGRRGGGVAPDGQLPDGHLPDGQLPDGRLRPVEAVTEPMLRVAGPETDRPGGAEPGRDERAGTEPNGAGPSRPEPQRQGRECIGRRSADRGPADREPTDRKQADRNLTEQEAGILAFERQWWKRSGGKERAIRELFDMSGTRYYQVLNGLLDDQAAVRSDPMLIKRLRKLRASRQRARQARRLGIEWH